MKEWTDAVTHPLTVASTSGCSGAVSVSAAVEPEGAVDLGRRTAVVVPKLFRMPAEDYFAAEDFFQSKNQQGVSASGPNAQAGTCDHSTSGLTSTTGLGGTASAPPIAKPAAGAGSSGKRRPERTAAAASVNLNKGKHSVTKHIN